MTNEVNKYECAYCHTQTPFSIRCASCQRPFPAAIAETGRIDIPTCHDALLGRICRNTVDPSLRGFPCTFSCPRCEQETTTVMPTRAMSYRMFQCDHCRKQLIVVSLKQGYGPQSMDDVCISATLFRSWFIQAQPEEGFVDVRFLPEYDRLIERYQNSQQVYYELSQTTAKLRNLAIVQRFFTTPSDSEVAPLI